MPAVIFDLDGTLIDSYSAHFEAWRSVSRELGHTLTEQQFQRQFGLRNEPILRELHAWTGRPMPDAVGVETLADRKEARYRDLIAGRFPVMAGAEALIAALRAAGWLVSIGSSAPRANIDFCLERFIEVGVRFDAVACGCDVRQGKPAPDVFLLAAARLDADPADCIVVEDAAAGIEAARRAGMASVGMCSTGRTAEELARADLVVDSFLGLSIEQLESVRGSHA
ncbi:MAG: HAD family phosphatase [Phycisphaerales bacterium]|nr:HAD family phosphatase [Phycisphaerales bacterium]